MLEKLKALYESIDSTESSLSKKHSDGVVDGFSKQCLASNLMKDDVIVSVVCHDFQKPL